MTQTSCFIWKGCLWLQLQVAFQFSIKHTVGSHKNYEHDMMDIPVSSLCLHGLKADYNCVNTSPFTSMTFTSMIWWTYLYQVCVSMDWKLVVSVSTSPHIQAPGQRSDRSSWEERGRVGTNNPLQLIPHLPCTLPLLLFLLSKLWDPLQNTQLRCCNAGPPCPASDRGRACGSEGERGVAPWALWI